MFDSLPATRPSRSGLAGATLPVAVGLHLLAAFTIVRAGATMVAPVSPPPIPVRFVSMPSAPPIDDAGEAMLPEPPRAVRLRLPAFGTHVARLNAPHGSAPVTGPEGMLAGAAALPAAGRTRGPGRSSRTQQFRLPDNLDGPTLVGIEGGSGRGFGELAPPLEVGGDVKAPEVIEQVNPVYPPAALQAGLEGVVIVRATINTVGEVEDMNLLTGDPLLARSAIAAMRQWRFRPGTLNGQAVRVSFTLTVRFIIAPPPTPTPADLLPAPTGI